jgi:hypothetical protein
MVDSSLGAGSQVVQNCEVPYSLDEGGDVQASAAMALADLTNPWLPPEPGG